VIRGSHAARSTILALAAAALLFVALQVPALAAHGGVHFDPDSPAGTEYALPLDKAREETSVGRSDGPGGEKPPLFGAGVSGERPAAGDARAEDISASARPEIKSAGLGEGSPRSAAGEGARPAAAVPSTSGGYPIAKGIAWVAAVVLLGGAMALGLRGARRLRL
jgi:hypothetical protein